MEIKISKQEWINKGLPFIISYMRQEWEDAVDIEMQKWYPIESIQTQMEITIEGLRKLYEQERPADVAQWVYEQSKEHYREATNAVQTIFEFAPKGVEFYIAFNALGYNQLTPLDKSLCILKTNELKIINKEYPDDIAKNKIHSSTCKILLFNNGTDLSPLQILSEDLSQHSVYDVAKKSKETLEKILDNNPMNKDDELFGEALLRTTTRIVNAIKNTENSSTPA